MSSFHARTVTAITDINASDWDACAGTDNPFVSHAFLSALEESGSATPATGWQPIHMVLDNAQGKLVGVAPAYVKAHSFGEYVFDHAWAQALERVGQHYYPKVQVCVPFTPVTGSRLLMHPDVEPVEAKNALAKALLGLLSHCPLSSLHMTFAREDEVDVMVSLSALPRLDVQYHWYNRGFQHFGDFLGSLQSRKRKTILKERREALSNGITIRPITGSAITETDMDYFYQFYQNTSERKWGQTYLKRVFYSLIRQRMADRIVLIFAERDGQPIAGAINFMGSDTLYGRHWGCVEDHPFLHFEVCYYQAIDYALAHGLSRVEAGAQGAHKFARGYDPVLMHSAHYIAHEGLRSAVESFLIHERNAMIAHVADLKMQSAYRLKECT